MKLHAWIGGVIVAVALVSGCDEKSKEHVEKAKEAAKDAASSAGEAIKEGAKAAGEAAKDAAAKTGEKVGDAAVKTGEALKEGAGKLSDSKDDAVAATSATMQGYLDSLSKGNSILEGIKSPLDASPKLPELKSVLETISANAGELLKLPADQQSAVRAEFKDQLSTATAKFKSESERISSDAGLGKLLGDALKNVKLFN